MSAAGFSYQRKKLGVRRPRNNRKKWKLYLDAQSENFFH